jgi:hypothetical protein
MLRRGNHSNAMLITVHTRQSLTEAAKAVAVWLSPDTHLQNASRGGHRQALAARWMR